MLTNHQPHPDAPAVEASQRSHRPGWRPFAVAGIVVVLLAIIAGAIWGASRPRVGVTARATPAVTATAAPRVVYQSDWSHGANGWTLPASARIIGGHLVIDGSQAVDVEIPYAPKTGNYAIEMDFQILAAQIGGHFGLTARNAAGDRQYIAQMQCTPMHQGAWNPSLGGCVGAVLVTARGGTYPSGLFTSDYVIRSGPQNFRLDVTGDTVSFCPVNDCLDPVSSAVPMDASPHLMIEDRAVKLMVTRVAVIALA